VSCAGHFAVCFKADHPFELPVDVGIFNEVNKRDKHLSVIVLCSSPEAFKAVAPSLLTAERN